MESKTISSSNKINVVIGILVGIGAVLWIFILSSAILLVPGILLLILCGSESCSVIPVLSLFCGGLIGLVGGIIGSRKLYKLILAEEVKNKSALVGFLAGTSVALFAFAILYFILFLLLLIYLLFDPECILCQLNWLISLISIIGVLISMVAGVIGGRKIYNLIKRRESTNLSEDV